MTTFLSIVQPIFAFLVKFAVPAVLCALFFVGGCTTGRIGVNIAKGRSYRAGERAGEKIGYAKGLVDCKKKLFGDSAGDQPVEDLQKAAEGPTGSYGQDGGCN